MSITGTGGTDGLAQAFTLGRHLSVQCQHRERIPPDGESNRRRQDSNPHYSQAAGLGPAISALRCSLRAAHRQNHRSPADLRSSSFGRARRRGAIFGANDDLSVIRGNHQLAFGAQTTHVVDQFLFRLLNHECQLLQWPDDGSGDGGFLHGKCCQLRHGARTTGTMAKRAKYIGAIWRDTWKVNQKLTLNYGLRWEPYFPMVPLGRRCDPFRRCRLQKGIKSSQFDNTPPGVFFMATRDVPEIGRPGQQVAEFFAACRIGMGCERRWPHVRCALRWERSTISLPPITRTQPQRRRGHLVTRSAM